MTTVLCPVNVQFLDHKHIIKDNVKVIIKIIINNKFQKPFSKGPKYHENRATDCQKAKENIVAGIKWCI